jgi:hypothetical protein
MSTFWFEFLYINKLGIYIYIIFQFSSTLRHFHPSDQFFIHIQNLKACNNLSKAQVLLAWWTLVLRPQRIPLILIFPMNPKPPWNRLTKPQTLSNHYIHQVWQILLSPSPHSFVDVSNGPLRLSTYIVQNIHLHKLANPSPNMLAWINELM